MRPANIFDAIRMHGHECDYAPKEPVDFLPTYFVPGTKEKLQVMKDRVRRGMPLWHPDDPVLEHSPHRKHDNYKGRMDVVPLLSLFPSGHGPSLD